MLDPKLLRADLTAIAQNLANRGFILDVDLLSQLGQQRKLQQVITEQLQAQRNQLSKQIGIAKSKGEDAMDMLNEVEQLGTKLDEAKQVLISIQQQWDEYVKGIPNVLDDSVPVGKNEYENQLIRQWGNVRTFDFDIKDHIDIGIPLGLDFDSASMITGSRFVVMHQSIARLHRALIQFMLDIHTTEHGYNEIYTPYIVNSQSLYGTGQLPKFEQDLFKIETSDEREFYLIPTAEVPVTNYLRDQIYDGELPLKFTCHTPCFRSEAGSYGRDVRGMIRQHQFEKVELVQFVKPEESEQALEELTAHAETILKRLDLPYQTVVLCSGDVGFSSAKTYDLEVWLPSQNTYREISSCSNFRDFQCRRIQARYRNVENGKNKPELLHSLNGSGLAVGRTLVAILENFQNNDGSVAIPTNLQPYMNGLKQLSSPTL